MLPDQWDMQQTIQEYRRQIVKLQTIVDEQAKDEGLWFIAETAPEAYLQAELRRLHAAIEVDSAPNSAAEMT